MVYALVLFLILSISYNFYVLLQVRKYRASLRYMECEFDRFAADAEERIARHESMVRDLREGLKQFNPEQGVVNPGVFMKAE